MTSVGPDEVLAVLVAFISYVITHTYRTYDICVGPDEVLLAVLVAFISYVSRHTYRTYDICGS